MKNSMIQIARLAAATIVLGTPAAAHVHGSVTEARPGDRIELALAIGHGCAGAATTGLRVAIPAGLTQVAPVELPGWQVVTGNEEIGWTGGELPDGTKGQFTLTATIAADATGTIVVPVVQVCGTSELRWIDPDPAADNPAPSIKVLPPK